MWKTGKVVKKTICHVLLWVKSMYLIMLNELEKLEKDIPSESNIELTDDEVLDAFNEIKSGEASRMSQKDSD